MVPLTRLVVTSAPGTLPTSPASVSTASGVRGSEPGRSLASGVMVIGLPVSPAITSGSAVGATGSRSSGSCTRKSRVSVTGSPSPSVTSYSTWAEPPWGGARKRTAPAAVMRVSAPGGPATASRGHGRHRVAVLGVAPVGEHRDVDRAAGGDGPHPRLEADAQPRLGVGLAGAGDRDADGGVGRDRLAAVVDEVLEARGTHRVVGQGDLHGLPVGADRELRRRRR